MISWREIVVFVATIAITRAMVDNTKFSDNILCYPRCATGFQRHRTQCYVIPDVSVTWGDALEFCHTFDSELVRVEDADEQKFLEEYLNNHTAKEIKNQTDNEISQKQHLMKIEWVDQGKFKIEIAASHFWIAATDLTFEGDWRWCNTMGPVVEAFWGRHQPDNKMNRRGHRQDCVALSDRTNFKWYDEDCEQEYHFVCEKPIY